MCACVFVCVIVIVSTISLFSNDKVSIFIVVFQINIIINKLFDAQFQTFWRVGVILWYLSPIIPLHGFGVL
jgi:hypothetical protein